MWDPDPLLFTAFGRIRIHFYPRSGSTLISFPGARIVVDPRIRNHYYRKVDPRIRIHFSQMWIQGSGSGFMSKWGWSKMLKIFFLDHCPHVLQRAANILVRTLMKNNLLVLLSVCHKLLNRIFERWPTMYNCKKVNASSAFFFFCHFVCLSFGLFLSIRS